MATAAAKPAPARGAAHAAKRIEVLDAAARVFNRSGLTNTSLDEIAREVGVSKTSLYYYLKNKEDLIFQCYVRACEMGLAHLHAAAQEGETGLERIRLYVRNQTRPGNPPAAALSEIAFLSPEHQAEVRRLARLNDEMMRGFIRQGVEDGTIAPCDPTLANFALIGTFLWIGIWRREGAGRLSESQVAEIFWQVFERGLRPVGSPRIPVQAPVVSAPAAEELDPFARDALVQLKRETLLKAATEFFNTGGYDGTSLDEIVASLGLTKGAFYYYIENKEDLLYQCYLRTLDLTERIITAIAASPLTGLEKLQRYIFEVVFAHASSDGPVAIYSRVRSLSRKRQALVLSRGKALQAQVTGFIEQGVADGSIRPCDPRMARLAVVGALNWMPKWYARTGSKSPEEVGAAFADFFLNGLAAR
jgi:AcrR family transcriptional regulator